MLEDRTRRRPDSTLDPPEPASDAGGDKPPNGGNGDDFDDLTGPAIDRDAERKRIEQGDAGPGGLNAPSSDSGSNDNDPGDITGATISDGGIDIDAERKDIRDQNNTETADATTEETQNATSDAWSYADNEAPDDGAPLYEDESAQTDTGTTDSQQDTTAMDSQQDTPADSVSETSLYENNEAPDNDAPLYEDESMQTDTATTDNQQDATAVDSQQDTMADTTADTTSDIYTDTTSDTSVDTSADTYASNDACSGSRYY